mgnify:CR=1 FL=1
MTSEAEMRKVTTRKGTGMRGKARPLLKIEITWSKRTAKVTSLTGGHDAKCLDLGDRMELEIGVRRGTSKGGKGKRGKV